MYILKDRRSVVCLEAPAGLGPVLLLLSVNDLQMSDKFNFYHFGDDTNVLNAINISNRQPRIVQNDYEQTDFEHKARKNFVSFCPTKKRLTYQPKIVKFDNKQNKNVALERKELEK